MLQNNIYQEIVCKIDPDLTELTSESILCWFLGKFKNYKMPSEIFWPLKSTYYPDYLTLAWKLRWAWLLSTVFCRLWWFQLVNCMYIADLYVFMQIYVLKFYPCHLYIDKTLWLVKLLLNIFFAKIMSGNLKPTEIFWVKKYNWVVKMNLDIYCENPQLHINS